MKKEQEKNFFISIGSLTQKKKACGYKIFYLKSKEYV